MVLPSHKAVRGFTLLELLASVAIITVLAALLVPAANRFNDQAKATKCASHLRQIGNALKLYSLEHEQTFPKTDSFSTWYWQLGPYLGMDETMGKAPKPKIAGVFICPAFAYRSSPRQDEVCYAYNAFVTPDFGATHWNYRAIVPRPASTFLVVEINGSTQRYSPGSGSGFEARHPNNTANYLFVDGHVDRISGSVPQSDPRWYKVP